jgi:thiamine-phosphate pyrophosphorylase
LELPAVISAAREAAGDRAESTVTGEYLLVGMVRAVRILHPVLHQAGTSVDRIIQTNELPPISIPESLELRDTVDIVSSVRAIDANANRARESFRVLDDYCRFVLNDATLTEQLKSLRHAFGDLIQIIPSTYLNESRDTLADIGTQLTADGEMVRATTADVARINFKRLLESLRSIEEFGKVVMPDLAFGIEALRYRVYTIEKAMSIGDDARDRLADCKLCVLLTGSKCLASLDWTIAEAAAGGATMFQLREKDLSDRELLERARNVRKWTRDAGAIFIVNDRPDIARLAEADGVHLGQDDLSVSEARKILGPRQLIGISTHSIEQVKQAILDGASYLGVGPTFVSKTKKFGELAGLEFVRQASAATTLPTFVIGGVSRENIAEVVAAGGKRVAISAAICQAEEPRTAATAIACALS